MFAALLALAPACAGRYAEEGGLAGGGDSDDGGGEGGGAPGEGDDGGGAPPECTVADDCVLVASTCCQCPSFAAPLGGLGDGCDAVECSDPPTDCPAIEAACRAGICAVACAPVVTAQSCAFGFARDVAGCLVDVCAPESDADPASCAGDGDCVRVAADCCGCELGGEDIAVAAEAADAFVAGLDCDGEVSCPGVDVCTPEQVPQCVAGHCALLAPRGDDGTGSLAFCGTLDHPPCEAGSVCVLNGPEANDAAALGVGACLPE